MEQDPGDKKGRLVGTWAEEDRSVPLKGAEPEGGEVCRLRSNGPQ